MKYTSTHVHGEDGDGGWEIWQYIETHKTVHGTGIFLRGRVLAGCGSWRHMTCWTSSLLDKSIVAQTLRVFLIESQ